jgi:hypothetical protein
VCNFFFCKISFSGLGLLVSILLDEKGRFISNAEMRKRMRQMRNGPGKNNSKGGKVVTSKGFAPNHFDRVLLDAPCSALGLRPRLFAAEVGHFFKSYIVFSMPLLVYITKNLSRLMNAHNFVLVSSCLGYIIDLEIP